MEFLDALGVMQPAYALLADKRMSAIGRERNGRNWVECGPSAFGSRDSDSRHCVTLLPFPKTIEKRETLSLLEIRPA